MIFVACAVQHTDSGGDAVLSQVYSSSDQDAHSHVPVELAGSPSIL